jgi:hypothetical protein
MHHVTDHRAQITDPQIRRLTPQITDHSASANDDTPQAGDLSASKLSTVKDCPSVMKATPASPAKTDGNTACTNTGTTALMSRQATRVQAVVSPRPVRTATEPVSSIHDNARLVAT